MEMAFARTAFPPAKASVPVRSAVPSTPREETNRAGAWDRATASRPRQAESRPAFSLMGPRGRGAGLPILKCRGPDRRDGRENWGRRRADDQDVLLPNSPMDNSRIHAKLPMLTGGLLCFETHVFKATDFVRNSLRLKRWN